MHMTTQIGGSNMNINLRCIPPNQNDNASNIANEMTISECVSIGEGEFELNIPARTITGIQDYLYRLDISNKIRHLFAFSLDKIYLGDTTLTVAHNAKRIISAGLSSHEDSIEDYLNDKVNFDPKEFYDRLVEDLFTFDNGKIMGARLVPGTEMCLTYTSKNKIKVLKSNYTSSAVTNERILPIETKLLVDYLLSNQQVRRTEILKDEGTVRLATFVRGRGRIRITVGTQRGSHDITLRRIPDDILPIEMFHLSDIVKSVINSRDPGLYLAIGEPGTGKTTLIASALDHLLENHCLNVLTIEDPIEHTFKHKKSLVSQIEIGEDISSVEEAVKKIKTDDPDIVFFTEIRSKEDAGAVAHLANMGVKVLATYHNSSVETTLDGLQNLVEGDSNVFNLLHKSIRLMIYQALLPKADGNGVTPAHGIYVVTPGTPMPRLPKNPGDTPLSKSFADIMRNVYTPCKSFNQDVYNLYKLGVITRETFNAYVGSSQTDEDLSSRFSIYPKDTPNFITINERC